ncbi:hypothetical protein A0256_00325 [Mucilaginibacter sp. PAMC 26640]|nr:hypothetical protein A0256_00325 [Mucilaginibacter sp. PAMC 26640]
MKTIKILFLIAAAFSAIACNNRTDTAVSGVYVADSKNEFTILSDTLIIEAYNLSAGIYHIEKRSGYHLIRKGKILPKKFGQTTWTATFDKEKQLLSESEFGKQIYLNTDAGTISFGGTYRKIK